MEQSNSLQKGDLEVTGVSRSGRVRKKSSKLMDFQSPDEIDTRAKKATPAASKLQTTMKTQQPAHHNFSTGPPPLAQNTHVPISQGGKTGHPADHSRGYGGGGMKSDDDQMDYQEEQEEESEEMESDEEDMEDGAGDNDECSENYVDPTVRKSIYMSEKSNKKKVMKDGKMVYGKAQRKDKGKTRFTAYMLWARDARKQMLAQQPDLDFGSISRRLGEMWANVPMSEKLNWKRRLKRYISKPKAATVKETGNISSKFLNKGQSAGATNTFGNNLSSRSNTLSTRGGQDHSTPTHNSSGGRNRKPPPLQTDFPSINDSSDHHINHLTNNKKPNNNTIAATKVSPPPIGMYKVTGIEPVDVAAHLKLLGDSLTIIGERLKEHEGQITVSGSLSVLLDSLLCSLGPLMCLTTQIPGFSEKNPHLRDTLHNTLDNIAYVMPGL